jgi:hypothetical protein
MDGKNVPRNERNDKVKLYVASEEDQSESTDGETETRGDSFGEKRDAEHSDKDCSVDVTRSSRRTGQ